MHDSAYKLLFSHPQMVEDLLRGFVPGEMDLVAGFCNAGKAASQLY